MPNFISDRVLSNHLALETVALDQLVFPDRELRKHPREQLEAIGRSLQRFGFVSPIVIDGGNEVIAGVARVMAARLIGMTHAQAVRASHLSPAELRAYRIADNKLAEGGSWDVPALQLEIAELLDLEIDPLDLGFSTGEVDVLLDEGEGEQEPAVPETAATAVSQSGDLWQIGRHRLMCGNALEAGSYERLLDGGPADAIFTDPPYNVAIDGNVCGSGSVRHREFVMASGEMSGEEFQAFLDQVMGHCGANMASHGVGYVCMDWRSIHRVMLAGERAGLRALNICVWDKGKGGMGTFYRSRHELIAVFGHAKGKATNNVQLGRHGRNRTNVWEYAGMTVPTKERDQLLALHPTVKPLALVVDAIRDCTPRDGLVLDPFGGSGTTMLAAEAAGRRSALMELDPLYADVILRRFADAHGTEAVLQGTGQRFSEVAASRLTGEEAA